MDPSTRNRALEAWRRGDSLDAGKLIYEALDRLDRPAWAARVLAVVVNALELPLPVHTVLMIARDSRRWGEGHDAFDAVRDLTLAEERTAPAGNALVLSALSLAENCAKVTYNASQRSAPFDHDAGWWVARTAESFMKRLPSVQHELEQALFFDQG